MKLRIELSRVTIEGKRMTTAFEVGNSITKENLKELFSANEQESFHSIKSFMLETSFSDKTYATTIASQQTYVLLNNKEIRPKKIFPINRPNEIQISGQKFLALMVIGRGTRK